MSKVNGKQLQKMYNISQPLLLKWRGLGLPFTKEGRSCVYDTDEVESFYKSTIEPNRRKVNQAGEADDSGATLATTNLRIAKARAISQEIKNDILKKKYIERTEVERILIQRASIFKECVMQIKQKMMVLANRPEIEKELDRIIADNIDVMITKHK